MATNPHRAVPGQATDAMKRAKEILNRALESSHEETQETDIWHASAEIELASATISFKYGLEDFDPLDGRPKTKSKCKSITECMRESLLLVDEALEKADKDIAGSYTNLRVAVSLLRTVKPLRRQNASEIGHSQR